MRGTWERVCSVSRRWRKTALAGIAQTGLKMKNRKHSKKESLRQSAYFPYVGMIQIRSWVGAFRPPLSPRISGLPYLFVG